MELSILEMKFMYKKFQTRYVAVIHELLLRSYLTAKRRESCR